MLFLKDIWQTLLDSYLKTEFNKIYTILLRTRTHSYILVCLNLVDQWLSSCQLSLKIIMVNGWTYPMVELHMFSGLLKQILDRISMFIVLIMILGNFYHTKTPICLQYSILTLCTYIDLNGMSVLEIIMLIHQLMVITFTLEGWIQEVFHQKQHTPNSLVLQSDEDKKFKNKQIFFIYLFHLISFSQNPFYIN